MFYLYTVCGIKIKIDIAFKIYICKESEDFLVVSDEDASADITMRFRPVKTLPDLSKYEEKGHWEVDRLYIEKDGQQWIYHYPVKNKQPYARVVWSDDLKVKKIILCEYRVGTEKLMNYSHNLISLIGLETLLLWKNSFLLHASFIRWKGYGILFSAPSGTGKSTQADLWVKYRGAEIINGDRVGITKRGEKWMAYGLPIAGSSLVYRNEKAQIRGIIVLRQAPKNRIRKLNASEAFKYLYSESIIHSWYRPYVDSITNLLFEMITEIPIWLLECRPDEEAVKLTEKMLER